MICKLDPHHGTSELVNISFPSLRSNRALASRRWDRFGSSYDLTPSLGDDGGRSVTVTLSGSYPTPIAAKVTGVTADTLDNWARRGILVPTTVTGPRPQPRLYTFRDLVAIRVLVALREAGIDPRCLRQVVAYLRKRKGLSATEALTSTVLVTDGHDVYEVDGTASISTLRKPGQSVLHLVVLDTLVSEVQRDARALSAA